MTGVQIAEGRSGLTAFAAHSIFALLYGMRHQAHSEIVVGD